MAKTLKGKSAEETKVDTTTADGVLRQPAEVEYAEELAALKTADKDARPEGWLLSPRAVRTYILGGQAGGTAIRPKYLGSQRVVEIAIATLATDRALLLYGVPGTAKCVKHDTLVLDTRTGERLRIAEACRRQDVEL